MFLTILFLIITLIFLPFPIFINITYRNNQLNLFLYKTKIKRNLKTNKKIDNIKLSIQNYNNILSKLKSLKFKPILKFRLKLDYGMEDASQTGITYGILSCLSSFVVQIANIVFNVTKFEYTINPDFKNIVFNLKVNIKIFINLFTLIFIFIFVIKEIKYANNN